MFFTRIGMIIAYVGFAVGALRLATGLLVAFGTEDIETNIAVARRYLNAANPGGGDRWRDVLHCDFGRAWNSV